MNQEVVFRVQQIMESEHELRRQYLQLFTALSDLQPVPEVATARSPVIRNPENGDLESDADELQSPLRTNAPPFLIYLLSQRTKHGAVAKLAQQISEDKRFPQDGDVSAMRAYLKGNVAYETKASRQLNIAYAKYVQVFGEPREAEI